MGVEPDRARAHRETPQPMGMGESISETSRRIITANRTVTTVLMAAAMGLVVSSVGAAERVVLAEYFTNLF